MNILYLYLLAFIASFACYKCIASINMSYQSGLRKQLLLHSGAVITSNLNSIFSASDERPYRSSIEKILSNCFSSIAFQASLKGFPQHNSKVGTITPNFKAEIISGFGREYLHTSICNLSQKNSTNSIKKN